jgi:hypothetical protein
MTQATPTSSGVLEWFAQMHLLPIVGGIIIVVLFGMFAIAAVRSLGEVCEAYYNFRIVLCESRQRFLSAKQASDPAETESPTEEANKKSSGSVLEPEATRNQIA